MSFKLQNGALARNKIILKVSSVERGYYYGDQIWMNSNYV